MDRTPCWVYVIARISKAGDEIYGKVLFYGCGNISLKKAKRESGLRHVKRESGNARINNYNKKRRRPAPQHMVLSKNTFVGHEKYCTNLNNSKDFIRCFDAQKKVGYNEQYDSLMSYLKAGNGVYGVYDCKSFAAAFTNYLMYAKIGSNHLGARETLNRKKHKDYVVKSCGVIAEIVKHYTGKLPEWAGCVGNPLSPAHFGTCVTSKSFIKSITRGSNRVYKGNWRVLLDSCVNKRLYETRLYKKYKHMTRLANINRSFPKRGVPYPDCKVLYAGISKILGKDDNAVLGVAELLKLENPDLFRNASCLTVNPESIRDIQYCFASYKGDGDVRRGTPCHYILKRYRKIMSLAGVKSPKMPSCIKLAAAFNSVWSGCVNYKKSPRHFNECLSGYREWYFKNSHLSPRPVINPDSLLKIYIEGIKSATPNDRLPSSYQNFDDDTIYKVTKADWIVPRPSDNDRQLLVFSQEIKKKKTSLTNRMISWFFGSKDKPRSEPEPEKCSLLADHPEDPDRLANGVADVNLRVDDDAINACLDSIDAHPDEGRYLFNLGRLLYVGGLHEDAAKVLHQAVEHNYHQAGFYLGNLYLNGFGDIAADDNKALEYFKLASKAGFTPARKVISLDDDNGGRPSNSDKNLLAACKLKLRDNVVTPRASNNSFEWVCNNCVVQEVKKIGMNSRDKQLLTTYFSGTLIRSIATKYNKQWFASKFFKCVKSAEISLDRGFEQPFRLQYSKDVPVNKTLIKEVRQDHILVCTYKIGHDTKTKKYWFNVRDGKKQSMTHDENGRIIRSATKCPPHFERL